MHLQERPSSKERELVFEAVTATMKQLKGSYSIISMISQARSCGQVRLTNPKLTLLHTPPLATLQATRWDYLRSATPLASDR